MTRAVPARARPARRPARSLTTRALLGALLCAIPAAAEVPALSGPALHYALHCQGCHRAAGEATEQRVPALRGALGRFLRSPDARAELIGIPGVRNAPISDADLAALLNWLLPTFDPAHTPAGFVPFSEREITLHRHPAVPVHRLTTRATGDNAPTISTTEEIAR